MTEDNKMNYVYEYHDPRKYGTPVFYVGKGSGNRIKKNNGRHNPYLKNKMKKIGFKNVIRIKVKLFYGTDAENKAYKYEQFLIDWYGLENLCNIAEGGLGGCIGKNNYFYGKHFTGENNPLSKLTWKIVKNIREEYKKENITYEKLAQKYNTDCGTIGRIIHNQAWKDENYVCENESFIKNGENHHNSFLNKEIVNEIRSEYGSGKYSQTDLAKKYNLNTKHINKILLNQTWKDEEYKVEIFDFKKGENSCKAKLNWQIVNEIRRIYNEEDVSCEKLAKEYDIHSTTVFNIVNNQRWKDSNYKNTKKFNFGKAKLNWEQVREIRHKYHNENIPIKELAEYYSVSYSTINGIINNKTWIEDTN